MSFVKEARRKAREISMSRTTPGGGRKLFADGQDGGQEGSKAPKKPQEHVGAVTRRASSLARDGVVDCYKQPAQGGKEERKQVAGSSFSFKADAVREDSEEDEQEEMSEEDEQGEQGEGRGRMLLAAVTPSAKAGALAQGQGHPRWRPNPLAPPQRKEARPNTATVKGHREDSLEQSVISLNVDVPERAQGGPEQLTQILVISPARQQNHQPAVTGEFLMQMLQQSMQQCQLMQQSQAQMQLLMERERGDREERGRGQAARQVLIQSPEIRRHLSPRGVQGGGGQQPTSPSRHDQLRGRGGAQFDLQQPSRVEDEGEAERQRRRPRGVEGRSVPLSGPRPPVPERSPSYVTAIDEEEGHPEEQIDSPVFTFNPNHLVERGYQERHHQIPEERPRHQQAEQGSRVPQGGQMQGGVFQRCEQGGRVGEPPNLVRSFDRPQYDCNPGYPRRVGDEPEERHQY